MLEGEEKGKSSRKNSFEFMLQKQIFLMERFTLCRINVSVDIAVRSFAFKSSPFSSYATCEGKSEDVVEDSDVEENKH